MTPTPPSRSARPRMLMIGLAMSAAATTGLLLTLFTLEIISAPVLVALLAGEAGTTALLLAWVRRRKGVAGESPTTEGRSDGPIEWTGR